MRFEHILQIYWTKGFFYGGKLFYINQTFEELFKQTPGLGGRVKLKYGGDAYGQSKKVKSSMNVDYNDPFKKLMGNDSSRFIKSTSSLTRYAKNLNKLKNSKQAKAALRKSLLVQNEKTRKDALKRLSLLKKLYSGGKSV